jgi:transcription initiation factor IIE alpha subunit
MVETICPNCGNRKSFEDSYVGKTFKCPSCSNPVTIQNLGSQLNTEPVSQNNSFADEIARAEA